MYSKLEQTTTSENKVQRYKVFPALLEPFVTSTKLKLDKMYSYFYTRTIDAFIMSHRNACTRVPQALVTFRALYRSLLASQNCLHALLISFNSVLSNASNKMIGKGILKNRNHKLVNSIPCQEWLKMTTCWYVLLVVCHIYSI